MIAFISYERTAFVVGKNNAYVLVLDCRFSLFYTTNRIRLYVSLTNGLNHF